jgi:hypothetical protein
MYIIDIILILISIIDIVYSYIPINIKDNIMSNIWTLRHLEELEQAFPECLTVDDVNTTMSRIGSRLVVDHVRRKVLSGAVHATDTTDNKPRGYRKS